MPYLISLVLLLIGVLTIAPANSRVGNGLTLDAPSQFGLKVINQLDGDKNVFISPFSIHSCLEMVYLGADGKTKTNLGNVLNLGSTTPEAAASKCEALIKEITTPNNTPGISGPGKSLTLEASNSVWASKNVKLVSAYSKALNDYFNSDARTIDFANQSNVAVINQWVKATTHGKIDSIVKSLDPSTLLMLINSAYFKAHWDKVFDKTLTQAGDFHPLSGKTTKAMMMNREGRFSYYEDDSLQLIKLPYTDPRFSMYVFLPRGASDVNKFCQAISPSAWTQYMSKIATRPGKLTLPRFKMDYEIQLKKLLSEMGMADAFTTEANFSKMTIPPPKAFIGDVIHKTYVSVNEEGTEAAAVTAVTMMGTSAPGAPVSPFVMNVDHPFFFAVAYEGQSGKQTILFAGKTMTPSN